MLLSGMGEMGIWIIGIGRNTLLLNAKLAGQLVLSIAECGEMICSCDAISRPGLLLTFALITNLAIKV